MDTKRWKALIKLTYWIQRPIRYRKNRFSTWSISIILLNWHLSIDPLEDLRLDLELLFPSIHKAMISFGEKLKLVMPMDMVWGSQLHKSNSNSLEHRKNKEDLDSQDHLWSKEWNACQVLHEKFTNLRTQKNLLMCREHGFIPKMLLLLQPRREKLIRPWKLTMSYPCLSVMAREQPRLLAESQGTIDTRDAISPFRRTTSSQENETNKSQT